MSSNRVRSAVALRYGSARQQNVKCKTKKHPDYEFNSQHYVVVCDYSEGGCGASTGGSARTEEEAIKAWNRRA